MMVDSLNDPVAKLRNTTAPSVWTISLDFSVSPIAVALDGGGCLIQCQGERQNVNWNNCGRWQSFLVFEAKEAYLTALDGHVCTIDGGDA